jgi:hypothetical protein
MAGSLSRYLKAALLEEAFGATNFTAPVTLYLALFTVAPTDAGGGTEVTGGSYARKAVTNNTTNFPAVTGTSTKLSVLHVAQSFTTASASWGTVVAYAWFDASSGGNMLAWADVTVPQTVDNGATVTVAVDAISVSMV